MDEVKISEIILTSEQLKEYYTNHYHDVSLHEFTMTNGVSVVNHKFVRGSFCAGFKDYLNRLGVNNCKDFSEFSIESKHKVLEAYRVEQYLEVADTYYNAVDKHKKARILLFKCFSIEFFKFTRLVTRSLGF